MVAEFRIAGVLCVAVPEEKPNQTASCRNDGERARAVDAQVVGECLIDRRRYLIMRRADGEATADGEDSLPKGVMEALTCREQQVAMMVCEGHCNKQIADRLKLSEWTVSSYLRRIYSKLDVHCRAAMVARMMMGISPLANEEPAHLRIGSAQETPVSKTLS